MSRRVKSKRVSAEERRKSESALVWAIQAALESGMIVGAKIKYAEGLEFEFSLKRGKP